MIVWRSPDMMKGVKGMVLELIEDEALTDRGQKVSRSDVGPILTKAQTAGKVMNAGKRVCRVTGRSAIVWRAQKGAENEHKTM